MNELPVGRAEIEAKQAEVREKREEVLANLPKLEPPPEQRALVRETADATRAWQASPGVEEQLAALRAARTVDDLHDAVRAMVEAPQFTSLHDVMQKLRDLGLNTMTIGIAGSLAVVVGAQGSAGVAFVWSDWKDLDRDAFFLSVSGEIGVTVAAVGGVSFGFYNSEPIDLRGWSVSLQGEAGDGAGMQVQFSWGVTATFPWIRFSDLHFKFQGFSITLIGGEDVGLEADLSYTFTWREPQVRQPRADHYMILTRIDCVKQSESGHDEVFFNFMIDGTRTYRYPTFGEMPMTAGDVWYPGRSFLFNDSVTVQLFDADDVSSNDSLGSFTYTVDAVPACQQVSGSGGTYNLYAVLQPLWEAYALDGADQRRGAEQLLAGGVRVQRQALCILDRSVARDLVLRIR
jgi:hypothetical protein